ncbi:hypothetical protein [Streptomyces cupreus]|uniref:hypothetical protein n=1 Tax=Streptomyces cupreus TaxID=2759956 RepID=UPI001C8FF93F|nr:hypothetical protein [Streptomyces cupreus]
MTFNATLIETGTESYRLARTKAGKTNGAGQPARVSLDRSTRIRVRYDPAKPRMLYSADPALPPY